MGFGIRVMPGVRVGVSSRGVRTSLGPRAARVHVGAGGTGFSTGLGPVSYYTSLGGGSSRSSGGSYASYYQGGGGYGTGRTDYEKLQEAQEIEATLKKWQQAHLTNFPTAQKDIAPARKVPTYDSIYRQLAAEELKGISVFKRAERKAAKERAASRAKSQHQSLIDQALAEQQKEQEIFDEIWKNLISNDPSEVYTRVTDAFGDNDAKASVINVEGSKLDLLMMVPGLDVIPERTAGYSPTGRISVKKMTASERNFHYYDLIPSQVLATIKEAFAVAPGITEIRLVALRLGAKGHKGIECVGYGTVTREQMNQVDYSQPSSSILMGTQSWFADFDGKLNLKAINLVDHPEIKVLVESIETNIESDPTYDNEIVSALGMNQTDHSLEELLNVTRQVVKAGVGRVDWVQRHFNLTHERAKQIVHRLKEAGVVGMAGQPDNFDLMYEPGEAENAVELMKMLYGPLQQDN